MTALRRGVRCGLAVLGAGTLFAAAPVWAQTATTGAFTERPGDALSRNLRTLAANPKSVAALMGAGKAALDLGDAQAALTFFARAEEQLPRDGRIKMWMGSALVQLQQPHAALKFFRDATELGMTEAEVVRDRGLAYDIAGQPRQAQRDYRLALRRGRDDEVTRRLALSLAISGEREPALQLLEEQLLVRDRAAERTRALVLALTGDSAGAARAVQAAMPGPQAAAMMPFLARLPNLSMAERALAVHLGIFPGDGRTGAPAAYAANDPTLPPSVTEAGRPDASQGSLARRIVVPEPVSGAPRRRPGAREVPAAAGERTAAIAPPVLNRGTGGANPAWAGSPGPAPAQAEAKPKPAEPMPAPSEPQPQSAGTSGDAVEPAPAPAAAAPTATADADPLPAEPQPPPAETSPATQPAPPPSPEPKPVPAASRLADLSAAIAGIPEAEAAPPRAVPSKPKPAAKPPAARRAAAAPPKKAKPAPPAEPSRVWVQVAGGADKRALPREYARLKTKAPKLLGSRGAWTVPNNATNRLLVGPFAGAKEAQAFVNQLKAQSLSGFAWTSAAGQKIEKLPAK